MRHHETLRFVIEGNVHSSRCFHDRAGLLPNGRYKVARFHVWCVDSCQRHHTIVPHVFRRTAQYLHRRSHVQPRMVFAVGFSATANEHHMAQVRWRLSGTIMWMHWHPALVFADRNPMHRAVMMTPFSGHPRVAMVIVNPRAGVAHRPRVWIRAIDQLGVQHLLVPIEKIALIPGAKHVRRAWEVEVFVEFVIGRVCTSLSSRRLLDVRLRW